MSPGSSGPTAILTGHPLVADEPLAWSRLGAEMFPVIAQRRFATLVRFQHTPVAIIVPLGLLRALEAAGEPAAGATLAQTPTSWTRWSAEPRSYELRKATEAGHGFVLSFNARSVGGVFTPELFQDMLGRLPKMSGQAFVEAYLGGSEAAGPTPAEEAAAIVRILVEGEAASEEPIGPSSPSPDERRQAASLLRIFEPRGRLLARYLALRAEDPPAYCDLIRRINRPE